MKPTTTTTKTDITAAPDKPTCSCPPVPTVGHANVLWKRQGQIIVGDEAGDQLGTSVEISSDGKTLVVGAPGDYNNTDRPGYVKVYDRGSSASTWNHRQTIYGGANGDLFGWSLAISHDGNTLAVGAPGHWEKNDRPGYVKIYRRQSGSTGSSWRQAGKTIYGEANGDEAGWSVSLSENGDTVAIGADGNGVYSSHVRVFSLNGSSWQQVGHDIDGEAAHDNSGFSTSLSSDGKTVAIGSYESDENGDKSGSVRVFNIDF